jgi:ABC-type sugar transport system ATPase subunit
MDSTVLQLTNIRKQFGGVGVLHSVDLALRAGEVHALVGENGAGKSTLMKIVAGILAPDEGSMGLDGQAFAPRSPAEALRTGIAMVHQELSLAPDLSVAENIFAGRTLGRGWFIARREMHAEAARMLSGLGLSIDPATQVASLSMGYRQAVEILKALAWKPKVLIFDEPTSSLESQEAELVLTNIQWLKAKSVAILYISHRMDEVFRISDRITVLRDGRRVGTWDTKEVASTAIIDAMVGRTLTQLYPAKAGPLGDELLSVRRLSRRGAFDDISFTLRRGEILGFSGLVGAGRTELMRATFAAEPADRGEIILEGRPCRFRSIRDAIAAGIVYVPEDRKTQGLFLDRSVEENVLCGNLSRCSRHGFLRTALSRQFAAESCRQLAVRARSIDQEMQTLSGGNQQKTLLARWLATSPKVLIVDEPTRGVDVGAKAEIHRMLRDYATAGNGVIVVSSEMPEVIGLCDRVIVLREGRVAGEVDGSEATEEKLIRLAIKPSLASEMGIDKPTTAEQ